MNTVVLDDEQWILRELKSLCIEDEAINLLGAFINPIELLDFCKKRDDVEVAILDVEVPLMSGLEVGKRLKEVNPNIILIYTTGYEEYALEAYKLHAIAYLLKPYNKSEFDYAIGIAKKLVPNRKIFIRTFGRFDIFINDKVIVFKRAKAKELLALLVDRQGGVVSMQYAVDKLWPERSYDVSTKQMYRDAISKLRQTLKENGCSDLVRFERGASYINLHIFDCDYYRLMSKEWDAIKEYNGEYMFEYDWSQATQAVIENKITDFEKYINIK